MVIADQIHSSCHKHNALPAGTGKGTVDLEEVADLPLPEIMTTIHFTGEGVLVHIGWICSRALCMDVCRRCEPHVQQYVKSI